MSWEKILRVLVRGETEKRPPGSWALAGGGENLSTKGGRRRERDIPARSLMGQTIADCCSMRAIGHNGRGRKSRPQLDRKNRIPQIRGALLDRTRKNTEKGMGRNAVLVFKKRLLIFGEMKRFSPMEEVSKTNAQHGGTNKRM